MVSPPESFTCVYRIVSPKYPPFDGSGTHRWGSRWISPGRSVVHTADSYALAVLENLVHWQTSAVPRSLLCVVAEIPDDVEQEELVREDLPKLKTNNYADFREIGDDWYDRGDTAVLWVPSVVSPFEANILVNQTHKDFSSIQVHKALPARIDNRATAKQHRRQDVV